MSVAKMGRPGKTDDIQTLVRRMLKKRDFVLDGKKVRRLDALIDILWKRASDSKGQDRDAMRFLLSYGFGTPVARDRLSDPDGGRQEKEVVEIPDHVADLIAEMDVEIQAEKGEGAAGGGQDAGNS